MCFFSLLWDQFLQLVASGSPFCISCRWFLPVNLILNFVIGSALGWAVIRITKAPAQIQGVILATCSAGNVGNLLLILVPAMCKEKGSPLGSSDVCDTFGLTYASLSLAIGTILQWSYVYNIVRIYSSPKEEKVSNHQPTLEFQRETQRLLPQSCTPKIASTSNQLNPHLSSKPCTPRLKSEENNATKKVLLSMLLDKTKVLLGKVSRVIDLKKSFAPSSVGVIIGFIVGAVPQIRRGMVGQSAPLRMIQDSATLLGHGTIPSLILITGGNLNKGLQGPSIKSSIIIGVIVVRYIFLPLVGIIIVQWAVRIGLVHSDPLYHFILLLQHAVPPAMNITSMIQMFEVGEGELSVIFLWSYAVASMALTLWSTVFLWIVSS